MKSGIRLTEKGNGKGEEKGYNSRFTSNTETVSRVACYLYIKATWKLAASLAYGIHRSIYRLFLSFPLLSSRRISYFPSSFSSSSPTPPSLLLLFSIRPGRFAIRRAGRQAPHSRSFRSIFAPPSPVSPRPSLPPLSPSRGHLGKELFIGQVSSPVTYVGRNRATPAKTEEI